MPNLAFVSRVWHSIYEKIEYFIKVAPDKRTDQSYKQLNEDFAASHKVDPTFELQCAKYVEPLNTLDRAPASLGDIIVNDEGKKLTDFLNDDALDDNIRNVFEQSIVLKDPMDHAEQYTNKINILNTQVRNFKPFDNILGIAIDKYAEEANDNVLKEACKELLDNEIKSVKNFEFDSILADFPSVNYYSPFPPPSYNLTREKIRSTLEAAHLDQLRYLEDKLKNMHSTIAEWLGYEKFGQPGQAEQEYQEQLKKILEICEAIYAAKAAQQEKQRTEFYESIKQLQEDLDKDSYNESFKKSQDQYQNALTRFKQRIDILNTLIKTGDVQNNAQLNSLLGEYRTKVTKAVKRYREAEKAAVEEYLDAQKSNQNYRMAVAAFYGVTLDDSEKSKQVLDKKINKYHEKLLENLAARQEKEWKDLENKIIEDKSLLEKKQLEEQSRIALFGQHATKDQYGAVLRNKSIAEEAAQGTLTTRNGLNIAYSPENKHFTLNISNTWPWSNAIHNKSLGEDLKDLMHAAKAAGIQPIEITINASRPEDAEELARRAFAAAIRAGYSFDAIKMKVPNRTEANKDKTEAPQEWLFNTHPQTLKDLRIEEERTRENRKGKIQTPKQERKEQAQIQSLRAKILQKAEEQDNDLTAPTTSGPAR